MGPVLAYLPVFLLGVFVYAQGPNGPSFSDGVEVGVISNDDINEVSGCAASRVFDDIIYVHNDHDNEDYARIFAINTTNAEVVATFNISSATNHDWEDIAVGPCTKDSPESCIYILDGGNVNGTDARTVYKVREPMALDNETLDPEILMYNWTETDSCVIMVDTIATVYIISRNMGGRGMIVSIEPELWGQAEAVFVDSTSFFSMPSNHTGPNGGDISPDGREILIKNREEIFYYMPADGDIEATLTGTGVVMPLANETKGESVCWAADASAYFTLSEGFSQPLFKYTRN